MRDAIRKNLRLVLLIVVFMSLGVAVGTYILAHQRLRFPILEEKPFQVWVEVANARGVTPGQGQTVRVAGMRVGDVGQVKLEEGKALVRMDLDRKYRHLVRRDATVLLRPRTGLKDMFLALDPGRRSEPAVEEGDVISAANSLPDVNADEILKVLDADTRAYLKLLINGAGKGLAGRGGDLRQVFYRLGPLHRDLDLLNSEVVKRRRNLARLIHNYGSTISRLGREDRSLTALVRDADRVFDRLAREDRQISLAVERLPSTLRQAESTLITVRELGETARPAFRALRPAIRRVHPANLELRPLAETAEPILRERIRPFVRQAQPYVRALRPAARDLGRASPDLRRSFFELNRFFNMGAYNPGGAEGLSGDPQKDRNRQEGLLFWLGWLSHNANSMYSTSDATGPFRRLILLVGCSTYDTMLEAQFGNPVLGAAILGLKNEAVCGGGA